MMSMTLGSKVKLEKCSEYSERVYVASSSISMKRLILVEEGSEKMTGTTTGYPTADVENEGMRMVGRVKLAESGLMICTVVGRMFLK